MLRSTKTKTSICWKLRHFVEVHRSMVTPQMSRVTLNQVTFTFEASVSLCWFRVADSSWMCSVQEDVSALGGSTFVLWLVPSLPSSSQQSKSPFTDQRVPEQVRVIGAWWRYYRTSEGVSELSVSWQSPGSWTDNWRLSNLHLSSLRRGKASVVRVG